MVHRAAWFALIVLAGCSSIQTVSPARPAIMVAYPFDRSTIQRPDVENCMLRILDLGGWGKLPTERAAFLIYRDDDVFECSVWPATNQSHAAAWRGDLPDGIAAVVHSHPSRMPWPSPEDARQAQHMSVPVFVVTRHNVSMVSPRREMVDFPREFDTKFGKDREAAVASKAPKAGEPQVALRLARGY